MVSTVLEAVIGVALMGFNVILPDAGKTDAIYGGHIDQLPFATVGLLLCIVQHIGIKTKLLHQRVALADGILFGNSAPVLLVPILKIVPNDLCLCPKLAYCLLCLEMKKAGQMLSGWVDI